VVSLRILTAAGIMVTAAGCGGSDAVTGPGPGPSAPTLLVVQSQILTPRCAVSGCHVGASAPLGLNLSSVADSGANLIDIASGENPALMRVLPGDSANSYLYWKITGNPGIGGEQMPLSGGPLSPGDIDLVASWIDGGAN
jgi:hypothetical protein